MSCLLCPAFPTPYLYIKERHLYIKERFGAKLHEKNADYGDFCIFFVQISSISASFSCIFRIFAAVNDKTTGLWETGYANVIPLWAFGLNY